LIGVLWWSGSSDRRREAINTINRDLDNCDGVAVAYLSMVADQTDILSKDDVVGD
jgi:hypothetical protein